MSEVTKEHRSLLLALARDVITSKLDKSHAFKMPESLTGILSEKRGGFVTLHIKGALRGCIGTIEPVKTLVECVKSNAVNAAFRDPRFPPLKLSELSETDIEISVLTVPKVVEFEDGDDLLSKLKPGVHGVILSQGYLSSTFLPQVWDQLPDKKLFLAHLCQKGRMKRDCWKDKETMVKTYKAEYFSELDLK